MNGLLDCMNGSANVACYGPLRFIVNARTLPFLSPIKILGICAPQNCIFKNIVLEIKVGLLLKSTLHGTAGKIYLPEFWI